ANVIALMRGAFRRGQSAGSFIRGMREKGLTYRRTDMLADWRSVNELERKSEAFSSVRKDYYPTKVHIAEVEWRLSKEYMYKVKVESRLRPDEPITERFVNLMADTPLTPRMVEQALVEKWRDEERYIEQLIEKIVPFTAVHRVME
ncbi:unnamed protein product, partial [marine sediment metagenome]